VEGGGGGKKPEFLSSDKGGKGKRPLKYWGGKGEREKREEKDESWQRQGGERKEGEVFKRGGNGIDKKTDRKRRRRVEFHF